MTGLIATFAHAERQGGKLTDAYGPGHHIPLQKVSDSTETPSPFYRRESPAASP